MTKQVKGACTKRFFLHGVSDHPHRTPIDQQRYLAAQVCTELTPDTAGLAAPPCWARLRVGPAGRRGDGPRARGGSGTRHRDRGGQGRHVPSPSAGSPSPGTAAAGAVSADTGRKQRARRGGSGRAAPSAGAAGRAEGGPDPPLTAVRTVAETPGREGTALPSTRPFYPALLPSPALPTQRQASATRLGIAGAGGEIIPGRASWGFSSACPSLFLKPRSFFFWQRRKGIGSFERTKLAGMPKKWQRKG